jgi:hypothetical protein
MATLGHGRPATPNPDPERNDNRRPDVLEPQEGIRLGRGPRLRRRRLRPRRGLLDSRWRVYVGRRPPDVRHGILSQTNEMGPAGAENEYANVYAREEATEDSKGALLRML